MKDKSLLFLSMIISAMTLLYLLLANLFRGTFIMSDWFVVTIDLVAKVIIDAIIFFKKKSMG